jgi:hypothetical protein
MEMEKMKWGGVQGSRLRGVLKFLSAESDVEMIKNRAVK